MLPVEITYGSAICYTATTLCHVTLNGFKAEYDLFSEAIRGDDQKVRRRRLWIKSLLQLYSSTKLLLIKQRQVRLNKVVEKQQ